jgi:hypothetical protein
MAPNPDTLAYIAALLRDATDINEVNDIWFSHLHELHGCRLIYASPSPVGLVLPSTRWRIKSLTDAHPRCLYSTEYLYFLDADVIDRSRRTALDKVPVLADMSIMLDSNVAGEVRKFVLDLPPTSADTAAVMDFLAGEHPNLCYFQYTYENARNFFMKPGHARYVWETFYHLQRLDHIDKENYVRAGDKTPRLDEASLRRAANTKVSELYGRPERRETIRGFLRLHYLIYVTLLKIVEIEFDPASRSFEQKLEALLDFMEEHMNRILLRELLMAVRYFKKRGDVSFMKKINVECVTPLDRLSNIAWDLMLFRTMEKLATLKPGGAFFIPYFVTFDGPTRDLFDSYRLKGLIAYGEPGQFVNIPQSDSIKALLDTVTDEARREKLSAYFQLPGVRKRDKLVKRGLDSPPRPFVRQLERRVCRDILKSPGW